MSNSIIHQANVSINRRGGVRRRDFLRSISAGAMATGMISWTDVVNAQATELRSKGMACILLWMQGGPSQFETFSPKPGHRFGGETQAVETSVSGIQISEKLPSLAQSMDDICLIRSMTAKEGSHPRASYLMHTGYIPTASVKYPTLGSNVANELGDLSSDIPNFVGIGRNRYNMNSGFLGVEFDPFIVSDPSQIPDNTELASSQADFRKRMNLLKKLDRSFAKQGGEKVVERHQKLYEKASRMTVSPKMDIFDISREKQKVRDAYGDSDFGAGCLLARRLVESGVTFVEVSLGNWDTHEDNFNRTTELCQQMDQAYSQLLADLKQRGMLDKTLVLWMGEFGRTPRINARGGRDHFPAAFNVALSGAGVRGGQVIGSTDAGGSEVTDRPVQVVDLFSTVFHSLGIDPATENLSGIGRPIKLVDGGEIVKEVFG